jgi:hypothetical protein
MCTTSTRTRTMLGEIEWLALKIEALHCFQEGDSNS